MKTLLEFVLRYVIFLLAAEKNRFVDIAKRFIERWCSVDFSVNDLTVDPYGMHKHLVIERKASVDARSASKTRLLIVLMWSWASYFLATELVVLQNCLIEQFEEYERCGLLFGTGITKFIVASSWIKVFFKKENFSIRYTAKCNANHKKRCANRSSKAEFFWLL